MRRLPSALLAATALAGLLAGCDMRTAYRQPVLNLPAAFAQPAAPEASVWPAADWWRGFGSPELDGLVRAAELGNLDLAASAQRVLAAEAQARIAGAPLLPTLDGGLDASRRRTFGGGSGGNTQVAGLGNVAGTGGGASSRASYAASLSAGYEIDFWGRNRAGRDSAQASLAASRFDRETVALTVVSGVANTYLQVLSLRDRLAIAEANLAIAERVLAVVEARATGGAASPLELAQQRSVVFQQRSAIPPLVRQEREARAALAQLLGLPPEGFDIAGRGLAGLTAPAIAPGLPSELLARRPDIRRAEAQLAAAHADVAAARAAMLPGVRLTGSAGLSSSDLSVLLDSRSLLLNLAAGLTQPIFDGGRLAGQRDVSLARRQELVETYRSAVLTALIDVENALGALGNLAEQQGLQGQVVQQAQLALQLAEARYRAGAEDLLTVLDAQRTLYQAQDQYGQLDLARLQASVGLYRALGGGWQG